MPEKENTLIEESLTLSLSKTLSQELIEPTLDLSIEYGEILIDEILDNNDLSGIPILSTLMSVHKLSRSIQNAHFSKKFLVFLKEFHSGDIDKQKLNKFKNNLNSKKDYQEKIIEHLIVYIDRVESVKKAGFLAKLFHAYINNKFDWETYCHLSASIEILHPFVISELQDIYPEKVTFFAGEQFLKPFQTWGRGYRANLSLLSLNLLTSAGLGFKEESEYSNEKTLKTLPSKTNLQFSSLGHHAITHALGYEKDKVHLVYAYQVKQNAPLVTSGQTSPLLSKNINP